MIPSADRDSGAATASYAEKQVQRSGSEHTRWEHRHTVILLCIVLAVGLVLRCLKMTQSFWLDELLTVQLSGAPRGGFLKELIRRHWPHLPLYYAIMRGVMLVNDSEWFLRLPSLLCSMAKLPLFWMLAKRVVDRRTAFIAVVLLAFSPIDVYLAQEARLYAMLQLVNVLGLYAILRAADEDRLKHWAAFTVSTALGLHLAYFGFLAAFAQGVYFLGLWGGKTFREKAHWKAARRPLLRFALCAAISVALFAPCLPILRIQWMTMETAGATDVVASRFPASALLEALAVKFGWGIDGALYLSLVALAIGALSALLRRRTLFWMAFAYVLGGLLPVYFVLQRQGLPLFMPKYVVFLLSPYLLLIAEGLMAATDVLLFGVVRFRPSLDVFRKPVGAVLALGLCATWFAPAVRGMTFDTKENWRDTCAFIAKHKQAGDAVITTRVYIPEALPYYGKDLPPVIALEGSPNPVSALEQAAKDYKRLWFMSWSMSDAVARAMDGMDFITLYDDYAQRFILKLWDSTVSKPELAQATLRWRLEAREEVRYHPWMDVLLARAYIMNNDAAAASEYYILARDQLQNYATVDPWVREDGSQIVYNRYVLAGVLAEMGEYGAAREIYLRIIDRMPRAYGVAYHLAEVELGDNNPDGALRAFRICREADPATIDFRLLDSIVQLYEHNGNVEGAFTALKLTNELREGSESYEPREWIAAARLLDRYGQTDRAIAELRAVCEANPRYAPAYAVLTEMLLKNNDTRNAYEAVQQGLKQSPENPRLQGLKSSIDALRVQ